MSRAGSRIALKLGGNVAGFLVVVGIVVAVNIALRGVHLRKDLTEERIHTLSGGTRSVLGKLNRTVTLKFFFSDSSPEIAEALRQFAQLKLFAARVEDLLREYELSGGGRIVVEHYDPAPDSDEETWAQRYGVNGRQLGGPGGPSLYLGLVAEAGDTRAVIPTLDPYTESQLEYDITRMILRVSEPKKPVVGVMSSLPVLGAPDLPYPMPDQSQKGSQPWATFRNLQDDYEARNVDADVSEIAPDIDALVIVHPKNLSDRTLYAIDQFVLRGGRLAAFVDPLCVVEQQASSPMQRFSLPDSSATLNRLLEAWGVSVTRSEALADLGSQLNNNLVLLGLRSGAINEHEVLTSRLGLVICPVAGRIEARSAEGVAKTVLLSSTERSGMIPTFTTQMGLDAMRREFVSGHKPLDIAVKLHGKFKTAFPDGRPAKSAAKNEDGEDTPEDEEGADEPAVPGLKESGGESLAVIVADADMLHDNFCVEQINFLGVSAYRPVSDNMSFFANVIDLLAGGADLAAIRSRAKIERPFEKVLKLEAKAQERWLDEEKNLEQKLNDTERRLSELQNQKDPSQETILSPEQRTAIEQFRQEQMETRKKLKAVKRNLRRDIDRLGMWVKMANIALMPVVVVVAWAVFGLYRGSRMRRRNDAVPRT